MKDLLIICADIGSVKRGNFAWADSDDRFGSKPSTLAAQVVEALRSDRPVALGFECPLSIPLPSNEQELGQSRFGEGSRPWSAGAGCGALATGLVQACWTLQAIRTAIPHSHDAFLSWENFVQADSGLLVWEAFVSGRTKGRDHLDDARLAVQAFLRKLPTPTSDIKAVNSITLAGVALLKSGWTSDPSVISDPCLAIKA